MTKKNNKKIKIGKKCILGENIIFLGNVTIGNNCFIAHGVMFVNDKFTEDRENWVKRITIVGNSVRIGSNATILPVKIGDGAIIGAGAVVTKDVPPYTLVVGNPGRFVGKVDKKGNRLS